MGTFFFVSLFFFVQASFSAVDLSKIEGVGLLKKGLKQAPLVKESTDGKKGLVVIFMSALCPCSQSHVTEIKKLSSEFSDFHFVGVNSNVDEADIAPAYFENVGFDFPIIKDEKAQLADRYSALKTPHVFIVDSSGTLLYKGGVSSSSDFDRAEHKYLREALSDIHAGKAVRTKEGRTLGCLINRGEKNVW